MVGQLSREHAATDMASAAINNPALAFEHSRRLEFRLSRLTWGWLGFGARVRLNPFTQ